MIGKTLLKYVKNLWTKQRSTIDAFREWQLTHSDSRACAMHPADYAALLDWLNTRQLLVCTDSQNRLVLWGVSLISDKSINQGVFLPR